MTMPPMDDMPMFQDSSMDIPISSMNMETGAVENAESFIEENPYPDPVLSMGEAQRDRLTTHLDQWIAELSSQWIELREKWAREEEAYRALSLGPQTEPFIGACGDVVPAIAMAVDPIHARLNAVTKEAPIFRMKPLRKSFIPMMDSLERFIQFYFTHMCNLRRVLSPRLLEGCKHGTCAIKVIYDNTEYDVMGYDDQWKPTKVNQKVFSGPRWVGVEMGDLMFPPHYQNVQDAPIVVERHRITWDTMAIWAESGKISKKALSTIKGQVELAKTVTESAIEDSTQHREHSIMGRDYYEIFEIWFDYDANDDGVPERMSAIYHMPTQTFLSLRYNWYFHQRKPYVIIPYTETADSLLGIGLCEMVLPFQDMLTAWHRHANNNAFLANTRMWATTKNSGIEDKIKAVSNRVFKLDNPDKDLKPVVMHDNYSSTLQERQNLLGLMEKRTGVSDYLTGRESPLVGSRATATSTVALIQEGTKRVEDTLDNIRFGLADAMDMTLALWVQYGLGDIDDIAFGDDQIALDVAQFFGNLSRSNVHGAVAVDLGATDAANNKQIQQQMQMAVINTMMTYYKSLIQAAQTAVQSAQIPPLQSLITETMQAANQLYHDLLQKYDIPNVESYLPQLEEFARALEATTAGLSAQAAGQPGQPQQPPTQPGVPPDLAAMLSQAGSGPSTPPNMR